MLKPPRWAVISLILGLLSAIGTMVCWGISPIIYKVLVLKHGATTTNFVRLTLTSIILAVLMLFEDLSSLNLYTLILVAIVAIFAHGIADTLFIKSIGTGGASYAVPLAYTYILFVSLFAVVLFNEPLTLQLVLGSIITFLGITIMSLEKSSTRVKIRSLLLSTLAAITWTIAILVLKVSMSYLSPMLIVELKAILMVPLFIPYLKLTNKFNEIKKFTIRELSLALASGVIALIFGSLFYVYTIMYIGVAYATISTTGSMLVTQFLSSTVSKEHLTLNRIVGAVVIAIGVSLPFIQF